MSIKEQRRRNIASAVFKQAWRFKKRTILFTLSLAASLKLAWRAVRSMVRIRHSKVAGVSRRQAVLWRLAQYNQEDIILYFEREPENQFDSNAVQVVVAVKARGKAVLGYMKKELAAVIAPILDAGAQALVLFDGVTGTGSKGLLGCNYSYIII